MFRKKRFKRYTLGRLQNFIKKSPYTGYINYAKKFKSGNYADINFINIKLCHYYTNVTKKKIYYTNNKIR